MERIKEESGFNRIVHFSDGSEPGIPLGKFRITIRLVGRRDHTELEGDLFDCTSMFLNPLLVRDFKEAVSDDIVATHPETKTIIDVTPIREDAFEDEKENTGLADPNATLEPPKNSSEPKTLKDSLIDAIKSFRTYPLSSVCRVLLLEQGFNSDRQLILQFGRLNPLTDYASIPDEMSRDFLRGQRGVECVVNGEGLSLPTRLELPDGLGLGYIHWIVPDDPVHDSKVDVKALRGAQFLCQIAPWVHHDQETTQVIRSLEDRIKNKDEALLNMSDDLSTASTELDSYKLAMNKLTRHGTGNEQMKKRSSFKTFLYYAIPTIGFTIVGFGIGGDFVGSFVGSIAGLFTGAWFSDRY
jgi:hypothetical protein